jgi:beta-galactosidase
MQGSMKRAACALLMTALASGGCAAAAQAAPPRSSSFDAGWRFKLVNRRAATDPSGAFASARRPGYDDAAWRRVDLPHDWSIELRPRATGGTTAGTAFLQGGLGWYRKTFTLPRALRGKRISLEFDGVYMDSEVYVNGHLVRRHRYGYTGFAVPLTGRVHTDGRTPDVVAVKVRNAVPSSRWYSGSGIYRHVHLVVTNRVHVARHGVFVTTPWLAREAPRGRATVHVRTAVSD